jgi:hypothetical protein
MLAGVPVSAESVAELADIVPATGGDKLADRLERALRDEVKLLGPEIDERAIILAALDDPPDKLAELRGVLMNEHQWRQREGLDP